MLTWQPLLGRLCGFLAGGGERGGGEREHPLEVRQPRRKNQGRRRRSSACYICGGGYIPTRRGRRGRLGDGRHHSRDGDGDGASNSRHTHHRRVALQVAFEKAKLCNRFFT
jgi:hypothetical protein